MGEYVSRFYQTIDEKGRVVLPGKLRRIAEEESGQRGVSMIFKLRECDGGLSLYTMPVWNSLRQHYSRFSETESEGRWAKRFFYMGIEEVKCDRQGRITIPPAFRKKAGLKDEIIIIGVGDHIEIWARDRFEDLERRKDEEESKKLPWKTPPEGSASDSEAGASGRPNSSGSGEESGGESKA